jgi:PAS domain S-box-containing protein
MVFHTIPDQIAILDNNHKIIQVNEAMAKSMGVKPEDLVGKFCFEVVHGTESPIDNCPHSMLLHNNKEHSSVVHEENMGGFFLVTTTPIRNGEGKVMGSVHMAKDITDRMILEKQLESALDDKDMLMKEVHHRVKNNLMIISSLLNLQSRNIEDEVTRDIFKDSQSRAKCMALIHDKLYRSGDLKKIDMADYIQSLIKDIYQIYVLHGNIDVNTDLEKVMVDINTAIPLGLIINELLTNSFKYAYPEEKKGTVDVKFKKLGKERYYLEISDQGVGLPPELDPKDCDTLGMQLIYNLTGQLKGTMEIDSSNGTDVKINLKELKYNTY